MDKLGQIVPRSQMGMEQIEWPRMESDESSFTNFSMFSFFDLSFSGTKVHLIDLQRILASHHTRLLTASEKT